MIRRSTLAVAFLAALLPAAASAHHVWLEQDASGARLFFGEYADNVREVSPGLLDKFVKPRAQLVNARGEARDVALAKGPKAFALATPAAAGESLLAEETGYPAFEKKDGDKVVSRSVWTPAARWISDFQPRTPKLALDIVPAALQGQQGQFVVHYKGQPLPDAKVEVLSPSGWAKEAKADAQGRLNVNLPWAGTYALEVKHTDKAGGERDGKKHDVASFVTTLSFSLAQGLASPPLPPAPEPSK